MTSRNGRQRNIQTPRHATVAKENEVAPNLKVSEPRTDRTRLGRSDDDPKRSCNEALSRQLLGSVRRDSWQAVNKERRVVPQTRAVWRVLAQYQERARSPSRNREGKDGLKET
jgi:hypothetical protein